MNTKKFIIFASLMGLTIGAHQWEEILAVVVIVLVAYLAASIAVWMVIKLEVTILAPQDTELILLHYKNNRVVIYEKPIWGKPPLSIIKLPNGWIKKIKGGEVKLVETELLVEMNSSTSIKIPLVIEYRFLGPFKAIDFQEKLKIAAPRKAKIRIFSATNMFRPVIRPKYHESLKADLIFFNDGLKSHWDLVEKIMTQIDFSDRFFSNMKKIRVEVGMPKIVLNFKRK
ncbi:MAG: hypothetical protein WCK59_03720 [Candidatus Falkowbacteria bacterium]